MTPDLLKQPLDFRGVLLKKALVPFQTEETRVPITDVMSCCVCQVSKNADVLVGYLGWLLRVPLIPRTPMRAETGG